MGYASHKIGYTGYAPTDDKLQADATIYNEAGAVWVTKITGRAIADVWSDSKLRFRVELRNNTVSQVVDFRLIINGVLIWLKSEIQLNWLLYTLDQSVTWHRGDLFIVQMKCPLAGLAEMKNFEICGAVSPMRLD